MKILDTLAFSLCSGFLFAALAGASDDMLILTQDYTIVESAKEGLAAKDVRQILYVTRDFVCIDEYGSGGKTPSESYLIDLKNQRIINLDHDKKQVLVNESFDDRRKRLAEKKKQVEEDLADAKGAQKDKLSKVFAAMLDTDRKFQVTEKGEKEIAGAKCKELQIGDKNNPAYTALDACLHPSIEMPYDNAEVLFLLKLIGENMSKFLKDNKTLFARIPMEMHIDIAAGGKLDTKVINVMQLKSDAFDPKSRPLGDPFLIPADYKPPTPKIGPRAPVESPKKERPD